MTHGRRVWLVAMLSGLIAVTLVPAAEHSQTAAPADSRVDQLLADVRAIRMELASALAYGANVHLFVGRVQVQEQRISGIQQIARDVARQIGEVQEARARAEYELKAQSALSRTIPPEKRDEFQRLVDTLAQNLESQRRRESELVRQQNEVESRLATEIASWHYYNDRLMAIESEMRTKAAAAR